MKATPIDKLRAAVDNERMSAAYVDVFTDVDADALAAFKAGAHVASLSPDVREALLTGICPACWDATFANDDEEGF